MGHLYFARHGQTVWNVENKICGATDIELTELGHQQAEELGQAILEQGIQIDEILYSPLIRAKETARHVSEVTGIPMREEMRLKEQNFGKYEGTPRNGEEFQKAKDNFITGSTICSMILKKNQIRRHIFWLHITGSQERYSLILAI